VPLKQWEFDALVSFAYVEGYGGLQQSNALKDLNKRRYDRVPADFLRYDRRSVGLQNRHRNEGLMFSRGIYKKRY
jgi:GH24 family phage-related lysozyme (muramidase)